jgi:hypothetical protein
MFEPRAGIKFLHTECGKFHCAQRVENPLICKIMNGKNASSRREKRFPAIKGFQKCHCKCGVIIVGVNDIGLKVDCLCGLENRPRKENETAVVIRIFVGIAPSIVFMLLT